MEKSYKNPMGHEDVFQLLLKMSFPAMLSMLIQALYNITDSYFVAKYSEKALRATSLSFPIQIIIIGVGVGTGIGIGSYISRALGSGREEMANDAAMHGPILVLFSWIVFFLFRVFLMKPFFRRFTTDPIVRQMGEEYLGLVTMFSFMVLAQVSIEKTIQGTGNMKYPMIIQISGAVTNIIMDPILIFGKFGFPEMGIRGAAIATIMGQSLGALIGLYILLREKTELRIDLRKFKWSRPIVRDIYRVGFPSMLMNSVTAFVTTIMNLILARVSEVAVSVLGIYIQLESFAMMPIMGLGQGVLPMVGYNYGAKNKKRVEDTYKYGVIIGICIMLIASFIFQVFPLKIMEQFSHSQEMTDIGVRALRTISIGYVLASVIIVNSVYFQALGVGKYSLLVTILRQVIIIIPLAYIFSTINLNLVWIAYPIAEFIAFVVSIALQRKTHKKFIEPLES